MLGFKNLSGRSQSAWLSTALTEMLYRIRRGRAVADRRRRKGGEVKLDLALAEADSFSRDTLSRIRNNLGADYVVLGSYLSTGAEENGIRLDLRLQDAHAGETIVTATETGRETDLPALVARAGARVREKLDVAGISGPDAGRARATAPSNAEAARFYSEGLRRLRIFDTLAAKDFLERAAAADPNHALTRSALALALTSLGDDAAATKEAKKAFDLSKDLSRENRLFVEGRYYETVYSWDKATSIYQSLYGFFPDNLDYGLRLAAAQTSWGKGQDALRRWTNCGACPRPRPRIRSSICRKATRRRLCRTTSVYWRRPPGRRPREWRTVRAFWWREPSSSKAGRSPNSANAIRRLGLWRKPRTSTPRPAIAGALHVR